MRSDLLEAFFALNLTSQDTVIFIDSNVIDMDELGSWLAGAKAPFGVKNVLIASVKLQPRQKLKDAIAAYTVEELREWIEDLENNRTVAPNGSIPQ